MDFRVDLDTLPAVDLSKTSRTVYVIADDEPPLAPDAPWERTILHIENAAQDPTERAIQDAVIGDELLQSQSPIRWLVYTAESQAHAARLARQAFRQERVLEGLEDVFHAPELAFDGIAAAFERG